MIEAKGQRLIVSINDLRRASPDRAKALLTNSFEEVSAFQRYVPSTRNYNSSSVRYFLPFFLVES
jgi:hypothetical protein